MAGPRERFEAARAELEELARRPRSERGPRELAGEAAYFKGSRLAPAPAARHALRRLAGRADVPRLQELANLEWLRARGFLAPAPLLAGVLERAGLPRYQFLFTALVPGARDLAALLPEAAPARRAALARALALDVAGFHALGFVHRDLFPRNVLAPLSPVPDSDAERCTFLDAWRSAPGRSRRPSEHDLGCLFLEGLFARGETALFLDVYRSERVRLGRAVPPDWPARVARARADVLRRESRRRDGLPPTWEFPAPDPNSVESPERPL